MKKKFLPSFEPARLVRGTSRWYISFYAVNDLTKRREKFKLTFNLNRITDLRLRARVGEELAQKITWWLEQGKPISRFDAGKVKMMEVASQNDMRATPIAKVLEDMLKVQEKILRPDSLRSYKGVASTFVAYLTSRRLQDLRCDELARHHAAGYLDHCLVERHLSPRSYNNQISHMRTLLNKLQQRGYLNDNPFEKLSFLRTPKKHRRTFTTQEARTVAGYIQQHDRLLFYALILEYACYIRPAELRRLRFQNIDLRAGTVTIGEEQAKDKEERSVIIPSDFLPLLDADFFEKNPADWYVFGENWAPHAKKPCGKSTMYQKHVRILAELHAAGKLDNITGLTWYSWKDTGITDALENLPLLVVKDQAGHSDPKMTLRYRQKGVTNPKMKGFKNRIV